MTITADLFEAYLKCPMKCWLRAKQTCKAATGNAYSEWVERQVAAHRSKGIESLFATISKTECAISVQKSALKTAKWWMAANIFVNAGKAESCLHALERVPSEGRGKSVQFVPIRFIPTDKVTRDDKLMLGFDALVFSDSLGRKIVSGKLIHGSGFAVSQVKMPALFPLVRRKMQRIAELLATEAPPDLALNRHCSECQFQNRCREKALEKDDLSLLGGLSVKEREKLRNKGIFSVTQLSYTFRPRRRPKRLQHKAEKYHHALKALAIREKKIHLVGAPELKIQGTPVYFDVEELPNQDFYYLIGARVRSAEGALMHSFWADTVAEEGEIWRKFLRLLASIERPVLIHYGRYESTFLKRMRERHGGAPEGSAVANVIQSAVNLLSTIYARIYFPTYSNGLKEIAAYLGYRWAEPSASGLLAITWRERWAQSGNSQDRNNLLLYNAGDCEALELTAQTVDQLSQSRPAAGRAAEKAAVDVECMKPARIFGFKRNTFFFPELDKINSAAYWDYQREKVYVRSNPLLRNALRKAGTAKQPRPNKIVQCGRPKKCPHCPSEAIFRHENHQKTVYDLKFFNGGIKRWIVRYHFQRYICCRCQKTFSNQAHNWARSKFGPSILAYAIYQVVGLRIPQITVDQMMNRVLGLRVGNVTCGHFKSDASDAYLGTYEQILRNLQVGPLLHADETRISTRSGYGFVWVFANLENVIYVYSETRESGLLQTVFKGFQGVLVSDFYAGYDCMECPRQKCLIHLIRDLNDTLLKHPYDDDLKKQARSFTDLMTAVVRTIDRHGLKAWFLKKHLSSVERFYRELSIMRPASEVARKCKDRFERNREGLFTFLRYDGVPWNNNNAEHAIKAFATLRHVIKGVTTEKGLREYLVLLSVCETCKYREVDFLNFLRSGERDIDAFAKTRRRCNAWC